MNDPKAPAIVLGGDSINALGVARNLGENNIKVYYVNENNNEVAFSRYCHRFYAVPKIENDNQVFLSFLSNLEDEIEDQAVLFPCSDLFCINLSQVKSKLTDKYIYLTSQNSTATLVNKRIFYSSLDETSISHPKTYFPRNYADVEEIAESLSYPILIKPSITQMFSKVRKKGLIVTSEGELLDWCKPLTENNVEFVVQELIPGPPTNIFGLAGYLDRNHDPKGLFAYRRLREWPRGISCNSLIESISMDSIQTLKNTALQYLRKIGYTGLFEAEFKKDPRDGNFKLIEINARTWWQNHFPTSCGLNVVMNAYLDALGAKIRHSESYRIRSKWIFLWNDSLSSLHSLGRHQTSFFDWLLSYRGLRDWAYFNVNDPIPWLVNPFFAGPTNFQLLIRRIKRDLPKRLMLQNT